MKYKRQKKTGKNDFTAKQNKYIEARISGVSKMKAKAIAGYNRSQKVESASVKMAIDRVLDKAGLNDDFLANELRRTIEQCDEAKTIIIDGKEGVTCKDPDLASKAKLLDQLAKLRSHGKPEQLTQVYNQYGDNNTGTSHEEVRELIRAIREELSARKDRGLLPGPIEVESSDTYTDVDKPGTGT
jgi:hypothetical protein